MIIPFFKAHGAGNDFAFTFTSSLAGDLPEDRLAEAARALCHRNTGAGADGWYLIDHPVDGADARLRLWNSDGSKAELSGNGTRCAAEILVREKGLGEHIRILTGAGLKELRMTRREGSSGWYEMDMGEALVETGHHALALPSGPREGVVVDVGNPQCAVIVDDFTFDWVTVGAEIEGHPDFLKRTNVSFVRRVSDHTIEARFYERGAGHTLSSGTGSTGAAIAAVVRGLVSTPVTVETEFCPLYIRVEPSGPRFRAFLTGPAEIIARGQFFWRE